MCLSIKTALLAGFKFQLIGPKVIDSVIDKLHNEVFGPFTKWIAISAVIEKLPDDVLLIHSDSFDVFYQMDPNTFYNKYLDFLKKNNQYKNQVIFNSESNCWPYKRYSRMFRCLKYSGEKFYNLHAKNNLRLFFKDNSEINAQGCLLQDNISKEMKLKYNKYLNSGVSFGSVLNYKNVLSSFWHEVTNAPNGCMDDQGFMGWVYGNHLANVTIDYYGHLVDHILKQDFEFDNNNGMFRKNIMINDENDLLYPLLIHHSGDKTKYVYMVKRLSDWLQLNKNKTVNDSILYVNGIEKKYSDVCGIFKNEDVDNWDKKVQMASGKL